MQATPPVGDSSAPTDPRRRSWTRARAVAVLLVTGVAAGGAVYAGGLVATLVDGYGGELGAAVAIAAVVGLLVIVGWSWWPLTGDRTVVWAVLVTAALLPLTTAGTIAAAVVPYDAVRCSGAGAEDFCELEVFFVVPTVGAVVPWTLAGLPGLIGLIRVARRRSRSARTSV